VIECGICHKDFGTEREFQQHYVNTHMKRIPLKCPFCGEDTNGPEGFRKHLNNIHNLDISYIMSSELEESPPETSELPEVEEQAPTKLVTCPECGIKIGLGELNRHIKENHPDRYAQMSEKRARSLKLRHKMLQEGKMPEEAAVEVMQTHRLSDEEIRSTIMIEGYDGYLKIKRARLEEVLSRHPRVTPRVKDYIMYLWDTNDMIREDINQLFAALRDAGLDATVAKSITDSLFSLDRKFLPLMPQRATTYFNVQYPQTPTPYYASPQYPGQQPTAHTTQTWQPYTSQPQYQITGPPYPQPVPQTLPPPFPIQPGMPPQPVMTPEMVRDMVRSTLAEFFEEKRRRDKLDMLTQEVNELRQSLIELADMRQRQAAPPDVFEKERKELDEKLHELEKLMLTQKHEFEMELSKKDRERLEEELKELRRTIESLKSSRSEIVQGYTADVYRFLGQTTEILSERKPLETVARIIWPERFTPPAPVKQGTIPADLKQDLISRGLVE